MKDEDVEIISKTSTQVGPVTVNFTVGRIKPTPKKPAPKTSDVNENWLI